MKPLIEKLSLATLTLALGIGTAIAADDQPRIYKSIDADGTTVFTDQAVPNATLVTPPPLNVVEPPPATSTVSSPRIASSPGLNLSGVSISAPTHQQTFIDPQAPLSVDFVLDNADALPRGYTAQVLVDGQVHSSGLSGPLAIGIPERGTHTLQIRIVDENGSVQTESPINEIHVRQHVAGG